MIEKYKKGNLKIVRNFNKSGGKFFYTIYKNKTINWLNDSWIGKISFDKKLDLWGVTYENGNENMLNEEEKKFIFETRENIEGDLE